MNLKVQLPVTVTEIFKKFKDSGFEIYLVGGAVRDLIMGRMVDDWDFTTNATPEQILEIIPGGLYNNQFGTVFTDNPDNPDSPHEITTFRKEEGYLDRRHPDKITWGTTLKEDLSRRDFTINSLALDADLNLIDLYSGQSDLEAKIVRAVGEAGERFSEDALRMMRAIRIAAQLGFTIEKNTLEAIKKNANLIGQIAKERVKEELFKLLASPHPYEGMLLFRSSGLMEQILPELEKCFGIEQKSPGRHHIYDVGNHLLMALKNCKSSDPLVRFATLIHDIGKPQTYKKLDSGTITFYNHEVVSDRIAANIAERLKFSNEEKERLHTLVRFHQFTVDERQTDSAIRRFIRNVGVKNIKDMLDLRVGDRLGGGAKETSWRLEEFKKRVIEVQKQPFSIRDLKINGNDVMRILKLKPGPKVGNILEKLFEQVVAKKIKNDRDSLERALTKKIT